MCLSFLPDFPANEIVKFLLGFTNKGSENFVVESLDASFRYPQVHELPGDLGLESTRLLVLNVGVNFLLKLLVCFLYV